MIPMRALLLQVGVRTAICKGSAAVSVDSYMLLRSSGGKPRKVACVAACCILRAAPVVLVVFSLAWVT